MRFYLSDGFSTSRLPAITCVWPYMEINEANVAQSAFFGGAKPIFFDKQMGEKNRFDELSSE